jgi:hypothetical protein
MSETPKLLTVKQFSEHHPAFSQASLRSLIFAANSRKSSHGVIPGNGLDLAIVRIGRKVLIDEVKFFEWVTAPKGGANV